jgi:hypothetical protein
MPRSSITATERLTNTHAANIMIQGSSQSIGKDWESQNGTSGGSLELKTRTPEDGVLLDTDAAAQNL